MASMSGVGASDKCVEMWEQLKAGKIKACQFKVQNNEVVPIEGSVIVKGTENAWKTFTKRLPENVSDKQKIESLFNPFLRRFLHLQYLI